MQQKSSDPSPPADIESLRRSLNAEHIRRVDAERASAAAATRHEQALTEARGQATAEAVQSVRTRLAVLESKPPQQGASPTPPRPSRCSTLASWSRPRVIPSPGHFEGCSGLRGGLAGKSARAKSGAFRPTVR